LSYSLLHIRFQQPAMMCRNALRHRCGVRDFELHPDAFYGTIPLKRVRTIRVFRSVAVLSALHRPMAKGTKKELCTRNR
jgi:hypothetical protein